MKTVGKNAVRRKNSEKRNNYQPVCDQLFRAEISLNFTEMCPEFKGEVIYSLRSYQKQIKNCYRLQSMQQNLLATRKGK